MILARKSDILPLLPEAPVAQRIRVLASEAKGRGFESRRARQSRLAAALLGAASLSIAHAADSGFYVGVGSGQAHIEDRSVSFDARSALYRGFVGYRLSGRTSPLPFLDFAAEGGYIDYGRTSQQNLQYHLHGANAAGLVLFPVGLFDLYGKGGVLSWRSHKNIAGTTTDRSGSNAFYGVGIGLRIGKIGLRTEYERYGISDVNRVEAYSASVLIQF
jgi:outer membrane protein with beta-barrel domain